MTLYTLILIVHVLGWVFWLGTDIGVFYAAKRSQRTDYTPETRLAVLELGMLLDRAPRFAVPVVWTTGMLLMNRSGFELFSDPIVLGIGIAWLAIVWLGIFQVPGSQLQVWAMRAQTIAYSVVIVGMGGYGLWSLIDGALPPWLAVKWLAYALVGIAAIWLERAFAPAVANYGQLAAEGSSPELEADLDRNLKPTYRAVLLIYAATLTAGVAGLSKVVW